MLSLGGGVMAGDPAIGIATDVATKAQDSARIGALIGIRLDDIARMAGNPQAARAALLARLANSETFRQLPQAERAALIADALAQLDSMGPRQ